MSSEPSPVAPATPVAVSPRRRTTSGRAAAVDHAHRTVPRPPRLFVPRQRLDEVLDTAVTRPLTVVVAPAGSGKTTSLARWATRSLAPPVRWLSAPLADPVAPLLAALSAAAHEPGRHGGGRDGAVQSPEELTDRLARCAEPPDVLVIDDVHLLTAPAWALLDRVVAVVPDHVRLVLAGRRDVPLATVALGLTGSITTLRADMLRFDDDEAALLIAAHAPDATREDVVTLQNLAQGWAAALVLGARTLGGAADRPTARANLEHTERPVLDYLLGEVFTTLPAATRHVLLCTCGEPMITENVATLLSGDPDAGARLAGLATDGLLVTSHHPDGDAASPAAWRLHPLLHELMRRQTAAGGPDHVLAVAAHDRAARHYAVRGAVPDAVRHATAAGNHELLVGLLVEQGPGLLTGGHDEELAAGLGALPDDVVARHPSLLGVMALASRNAGHAETASRLAEQAIRAAAPVRARLMQESGTAPVPSAADLALVADAALLGAYQARFGWADCRDAIGAARAVLGCAADHDHPAGASSATAGAPAGTWVAPLPSHRWPLPPARAAWLLHELATTEIWAGDLAAASVHVGEALTTARALGHGRMVAAALANRAVLELLDCRFQTAAASAAECLAAAGRAGRSQDLFLSRAFLALGWAACYDVRLGDAETALANVEAIDDRAPDPLVTAMALVLRARLRALGGDVAGARRLLATDPPVPGPAPPFLVSLVAASRADWALVAGDLQEARRQATVLRGTGSWLDDTAIRWVLADLDGDARGASRLLDQAMRTRSTGPAALVGAVAAVYRTRIHLRGGDREAARVTLHDALSRVSAQRVLYPLVRVAAADPAYEALLEDAAAGPSPHPFAGEALQTLHRCRQALDGLAPPQPTRPAPGAGHPVGTGDPRLLPVPLTRRETDVLRELALGGSYLDIARTLYVTENTVKTHVASMYRKLGADRRASALRRAREAGLI